MKEIILFCSFTFSFLYGHAQIAALGISPVGAEGSYDHTWAKPSLGWGTLDFNIPGNYVQGDLILVNDGTPGTNETYGNLLSEEGCNPSPGNAYAGKICVIRRNTCEFGYKAWEAQNAGAIGVIIVNRDPQVIEMNPGSFGGSVSIPVVMLSNGDGNYLISLMQSNTVNMLLGNIQGIFDYNLSIKKSTTLVPKRGMTPAVIAQNGSEFNFDVGTKIYNFGNQAQSGVSLNVQVKNPNNVTVYNQTVSNITIAAADSFSVVPGTLPAFQLASYMNGQYELIYTVSSSNNDAYSFDNSLSYYFSINNDIYSYAGPNALSGLPENDVHYQPGNSFWEHKMCNVISDPNASRMSVQGFHFSAISDAGVDLTGNEIPIELFRWEDQFTDLNDPNFALNNTTLLASGYYYFPSNLQSEMVYAPLDSPVALDDNQRYLACVTNWNNQIYLSYTHKVDYTENTNLLSQPLYISYVDGSPIVNPPNTSWGVPGLGVKIYNCPTPLVQTVNTASCVSYTSASGQVYTQSGTYEEIIPNMFGCDSIVTTLNLTINASDFTGSGGLVEPPSCTAPADGSITVYLGTEGSVLGDIPFISEYFSGNGSNNWIEIYNPTAEFWNLGSATYDPSNGLFLGPFRLNSGGQSYVFPQPTIVAPFSTVRVSNPLALPPASLSSNIINGASTTMDIFIADFNNWFAWDAVQPASGNTIVRLQSVNTANSTFTPGEWAILPLSSATPTSHYEISSPTDYTVVWSDGTTGNVLNNISPGTYYYTVHHAPSGCVIEQDPVVVEGAVYNTISATICEGEVYAWNDQEYIWPGQYEQTLTNQFGCDSVVTLNLNVNYNDFLTIAANPAFGNAPLNVAFANQTQNLSAYNFTWYFGDGSSQQSNAPFLSHIYTQGGYSDVSLVAENTQTGCVSTQFYDNLIFVIGGVSCTHSATIQESGPLSGCAGSQLTLTASSDPSFTYQWNNNGIPVNGATLSTINPTQSGNYSVTIYQNSCPVTSASVNVTIYPAPPVPLITSSGDITSCSNQSVTLSATPGYSGYAWSNGATTQTIETAVSGDYTVTVTNSGGCSTTSNLFALNASIIDPISLCIIGMDSLTFGNRLVWEKPAIEGIDSFYVYRETNAAGVYARIGELPYEVDAIFLDDNANTAVQAYRYKLSALDTCGNETLLGDFHKTIHLTINQGVGNSWNLIWSHYEGIDFPSYNIYRGADQASMELLTTIQSNLNSYTDLSPPAGAIYYQIEVVNPNSCDPTRAYGIDVSRSNIVNNGFNNLSEKEKDIVKIYPNPTSGEVTIITSSELQDSSFELLDVTGRIVYSGNILEEKTRLNLIGLSDGHYLLRIGSVRTYKIIKR